MDAPGGASALTCRDDAEMRIWDSQCVRAGFVDGLRIARASGTSGRRTHEYSVLWAASDRPRGCDRVRLNPASDMAGEPPVVTALGARLEAVHVDDEVDDDAGGMELLGAPEDDADAGPHGDDVDAGTAAAPAAVGALDISPRAAAFFVERDYVGEPSDIYSADAGRIFRAIQFCRRQLSRVRGGAQAHASRHKHTYKHTRSLSPLSSTLSRFDHKYARPLMSAARRSGSHQSSKWWTPD